MKGIGGHHRAFRGRSDDWITPREIIEALGPFDMDPCACSPQPWRTAARMLSVEEDGLSSHWKGRVWLNPPYGPMAEKWVDRLATHGLGTAILFARTETRWFVEHVWRRASALRFLFGRVHFFRPDGTRAIHNAGGPSVLISYGALDADRLWACSLDGHFVRLEGR